MFNGLLTAVAITPELKGYLMGVGLLGFALVESALLFAMLCGFACLFVCNNKVNSYYYKSSLIYYSCSLMVLVMYYILIK